MSGESNLALHEIAAIAADKARFPQELMKSLGFVKILSLGKDGRARVLFDVPENLSHSNGSVVQGGVLSALLDHAMAWSAAGHDSASGVTTLEMKVSYLGSVRPGECVADVRIVRAGRRVVFLEGQLEQPTGKIAVTASSTCMRVGVAIT